MTSSVGIIEWVSNTKPLKSVLEGEQTPEEKAIKPQALHADWMTKGSFLKKKKKRK